MLRGAAAVLGCLLLIGCSQPTSAPSAGQPSPAATQDAAPPAASATTTSTGVLNGEVIGARISPELERCLNAGDAAKGATFPMFDCLTAEIEVQDTALNRVYQALLTTARRSDAEVLRYNPEDAYGSARTTRIVEAQKAWLAYRDGKCLTENDGEGQLERFSGYPNCLLTETIKRTIELEQLKSSIEQD